MKLIQNIAEISHLFTKASSTVIHSGCAAPRLLSKQLSELAAMKGPFNLVDMSPMGRPDYIDGVLAGDISLTTFLPSREVRPLVNSGKTRVIRLPLSQIPAYYAKGGIQANLLLLQLSPPDADGRMSLGICMDSIVAVLAQKPVVIAEINTSTPRTFGALTLSEDDIDFCIETDLAPLTLNSSSRDATDTRIAENIASLIQNGSCLQAGIGSIPDTAISCLSHLNNLRIHTGILTDSMRALIQKGVVQSDERKHGKAGIITTMAGGSEELYRFINNNRSIRYLPCDQTHNFENLTNIDQFCAINSAIEVDLTGNINATHLGDRVIAAPGGMPDFAAGAAVSENGKSIISLRATSRDGGMSRIVTKLQKGQPMTISGAQVDYIVTEFGIAAISGLGSIECARAIGAIAAPEFRSELRAGIFQD